MKRIGLDAGHYPGDCRVSSDYVKALGTRDEYTLNQRQYYAVDRQLKAAGYEVVDIGRQDRNLINRAKRARAAGCDIVLSIHHNAGGGRGLTLYRNSNGILGSVSQRLEEKLYAYLGPVNRGNRSQPINSASLAVINAVNTNCPSVLIEVAFMDNPVDVSLINKSSFQEDIARAIVSGVDDYFGVAHHVAVSGKKATEKTVTIRKDIVTRKDYSWLDSAIIGKAYGGEKHYVVEQATVEGSLMYRTNEGRYITGASAYTTTGTPDMRLQVVPHVQSYGTLGRVPSGCVAGTVGEAKRLEGFMAYCDYPLQIQAHCQGHGWMSWKGNGEYVGTKGEAKRLEAVRIKRTDGGHIRYRVHVQGIGWTGWAKDGAVAGTTGQRRRVEAIQIELA